MNLGLKPRRRRSCSAKDWFQAPHHTNFQSRLPCDSKAGAVRIRISQFLLMIQAYCLLLVGYVFREQLCGFIKPSAGRLLWDGVDLSQPGLYDCKIDLEILVLCWQILWSDHKVCLSGVKYTRRTSSIFASIHGW